MEASIPSQNPSTIWVFGVLEMRNHFAPTLIFHFISLDLVLLERFIRTGQIYRFQ
jgi:hypothetical protein